jgi:hypothetical protein
LLVTLLAFTATACRLIVDITEVVKPDVTIIPDYRYLPAYYNQLSTMRAARAIAISLTDEATGVVAARQRELRMYALAHLTFFQLK